MTQRFALPAVTTEQMRAVDSLMSDRYGIELLQMMENAGWNLALLAKRLLENDLADRPIVVLAGRGNNGGGGLVAARHLLNWGAWVQVVLTCPAEEHHGVSAHQLATLQAMAAPLAWAEEGWELPPADLIIDALIGSGLQGAAHGKARELILLANSSMAPILSFDVPSGLDSTMGLAEGPTIRANATMTLALPKIGLLQPSAQVMIGDLYLADMSVPPALYHDLGVEVPPLFAMDTVLPVTVHDGVASVPVATEAVQA